MSKKPTKIWLDCDPGHDDAFAIILAGHSKSVEVLGISTVAGNQTVDKTTLNALKVLAVSGLSHIPVVSGQAVPLVRPSRVCPEIHGQTGLDCNNPTSAALLHKSDHGKPVDKKAIIMISDTIMALDEKVTLVATGCLTNYALLLSVFPEIKQKVEKIVLLGGAIGIGNISPSAEFNILIDPEAAKIVFESGIDIVMVPIEVSHSVLVVPDIISRIKSFDSPFGQLCVDLLSFFGETYKKVFYFDYPPLHDPLAVAYVIDPSLFVTRHLRVDIETQSDLCAGRTICDLYENFSKMHKNAHVAQSVNLEGFWNLMIESLQEANKVSRINVK